MISARLCAGSSIQPLSRAVKINHRYREVMLKELGAGNGAVFLLSTIHWYLTTAFCLLVTHPYTRDECPYRRSG